MRSLEIIVTRARGAQPGSSVRAVFDESGGTIGRADTNTLVLDDPDRTVSRMHAQIVVRDGRFFIVDRGSNPLSHNQQSVGNGNERPLSDGDQLSIGSFDLVVRLLDAGADEMAAPGAVPGSLPGGIDDDPFADLLAGLAPERPSPASTKAPAPDDPGIPDPFDLASSGGAVSRPDDPFADLMGGVGAEPQASPGGALTPGEFADLSLAPSAGGSRSIDALFDLGGGIGGDPLALSPLADPLAQPNTANTVDPLASFQQPVHVMPSARSDHLPIEQFGFQPPRSLDPPDDRGMAPPDRQLASEPSSLPLRPAERVGVHIDRLDPAPPPATGRSEQMQDSAPVPIPADAPLDRVSPVFTLQPTQRRSASTSTSTSSGGARSTAPTGNAGTGSADELLAAFVRGLGGMHQPPAALTPDLMERVGRLLRTSTEGALQLLLTRQEFKREVRAQVTMIAAQANNPLKFSPTVEVALAHLLGPGARGFMPAEAAMRDAYQDLRAHEFGVMVGMRAALAHVIEQFAPDALEQNIAARSKLDAIFSANRKARLWDQFVALYGSIAKEAEDDFHNLFGKAFLQAYEEQMERLKNHDADSHGA